MKRKTPRQRVAGHLLRLGYALNERDIKHVQGGAHKRLSDIIECWHVFAAKDGVEVEIRSAFTLTQCAKGIKVIPNSRESDLYGDFVAEPLSITKPSE